MFIKIRLAGYNRLKYRDFLNQEGGRKKCWDMNIEGCLRYGDERRHIKFKRRIVKTMTSKGEKRSALLPVICKALTFHLDNIAQHRVNRGDNLGIGLETALGGNHFDKFISNIHI